MRLSRRPLPEADSFVDRLSDEDRKLVVLSWAGRAQAELTACHSFQVIADSTRSVDAEEEIQALALRAVEDERWHSQICHRMACIVAGKELPEPTAHDGFIPEHAGAPESLRRTLWIVGQCSLNETTGSAFYETCLSGAKSAPARATLRALLSDEIDHARIGWAHLASPKITQETRLGVANWLPTMLRANWSEWTRRLRLPDRPGLVENGSPSYDTGMAAVEMAFRDLIRPGFERLGYDLSAVHFAS